MIAGKQTMFHKPIVGPPWDWDYDRNIATRLAIASSLTRSSVSYRQVSIPSEWTIRSWGPVYPTRPSSFLVSASKNGSTTQSELCLFDVENGVIEQTGVIFQISSSYPGAYMSPQQDGGYVFFVQNGKTLIRIDEKFNTISSVTASDVSVNNPGRMITLLDGRILIKRISKSNIWLYNSDFSYIGAVSNDSNSVDCIASPTGGFVTCGYSGEVSVFNSSMTRTYRGSVGSYYGPRFIIWPALCKNEVYFLMSGHSVGGKICLNIETSTYRTTSVPLNDTCRSSGCILPNEEAFWHEDKQGTDIPNNRANIYNFTQDTNELVIESWCGSTQCFTSLSTLPNGKVFARGNTGYYYIVDFGFHTNGLLPGELFTSPFGYNRL